MTIKNVRAWLLLLMLLLPTFVWAGNLYYSSPAFPEYELLLNGNPRQLIKELDNLNSQKSKKDKAELLLLRSQAHLALGDKSQATIDINLGLDHSLEIENKGLEGSFYLLRGQIFQSFGELSKAKEIIQKGFERIETTDDERLIARASLNIGHNQLFFDDYESALRSNIIAYEIYQRNNDTLNLSNALGNIAMVYDFTEEYAKAIEYYNKSIETLDLSRDFHLLSVAFFNLAYVYDSDGQLNKAKSTFHKSMSFSRKFGNKLDVAYCQYRLGTIAIKQNDFEKAENYLLEALTVLKLSENLLGAYSLKLHLVNAYLSQEKNTQAREMLTETEVFLEKLESPSYEARWFLLKSRLEALDENYESAYLFHKKYMDRILIQTKQDKKSLVHNLQAKFEIEQQEADNKILKSQNKIQQLSLDKEEAINRVNFIVILLFVMLAVFVSYHIYRQRRFRKTFETLALTDELTGLPNRRMIMQLASEEISRAKRHKLPLIIGLIDLDYFKKINDNHGHVVGDQALKQFSLLAKGGIRDHDHIGRIGGEEWLILFPHTTQAELESVIKRIREAVLNMQPVTTNENVTLTFSMGLTMLSDKDEVIEDLIIRADSALYKAKHNGRNCHFYDK